MSERRKMEKVISRARREAYAIVRQKVRKTLPAGWKLHLAVGWGLCLDNAEGKTVIGPYTGTDRLPRGVRHACLLAADYVDVFGYGNEVIVGERKA